MGKEYKRFVTVFKNYFKNLSEYSNLNLKQDVLLLPVLFENFSDICLKSRVLLLLYNSWNSMGCIVEINKNKTPKDYKRGGMRGLKSKICKFK